MHFSDKIEVKKLSPSEWAILSRNAHLLVFNEVRESDMDRISFALMCEEDGLPLAYATIRELDKESVYWQYGGSFPSAKNTVKSVTCYRKVAEWCKDAGYKRVTTYVENTNTTMLKMALSVGFKAIGIRNFKQTILLELLLEY